VPDRWLFNYAHAVVEAKIDRQFQPRVYIFQVGLRSILASFRWNRSLSAVMQNEIIMWAKKI